MLVSSSPLGHNGYIKNEMTLPFFTISSPRDLLGKAKRDFIRMKEELYIDTIFNFFVTIYHVKDYVEKCGLVNPVKIKEILNDADFVKCRYLCDKGKHLELRRGDQYQTQYYPGAVAGEVRSGEVVSGEPASYVLVDGSEEIDILRLGETLIDKWELFFSDNAIP